MVGEKSEFCGTDVVAFERPGTLVGLSADSGQNGMPLARVRFPWRRAVGETILACGVDQFDALLVRSSFVGLQGESFSEMDELVSSHELVSKFRERVRPKIETGRPTFMREPASAGCHRHAYPRFL